MKDIKNTMKALKSLYYGFFIKYHLRLAHKHIDRNTVRDYHCELARYYYNKAYGKDMEE